MQLYEDRPSGAVMRARYLRRNASPFELRLLRALRESFPAQKWRHQVPVGPYYADILCFSEKLVIEVDGDTHRESGGYDDARTSAIEDRGFHVVRVANNDVAQNLDGVIARLSFALEKSGSCGRGTKKGAAA